MFRRRPDQGDEMSEMSSAPNDLALPWLLVATPQLVDPNFRQAVVLMVEHSRTGSMGFIVNRPLEGALADVVTLPDEEIPENLPAWFGGPVETRSGLVMKPAEQNSFDAVARTPTPPAVTLSASEDLLKTLIKRAAAKPPPGAPLYPFRFILGYAGWGAGQLHNELLAGAWIQVPATDQLVFDTPWRDLWERAMRVVGATPRSLAPVEHNYLH